MPTTMVLTILSFQLKLFGIFVIAQTSSRETQNPFCAGQIKAPSNYLNLVSVGGVQVLPDNTLIRSAVSTGGPLFLSDGSIDFTHVKPDLVAVCERVSSSVFIDGTSYYLEASSPAIAATAVAGAVALLWSAKPELIRNVAATSQLFKDSADRYFTTDCSSVESGYPNNVFGYGNTNVGAAFEASLTSFQDCAKKVSRRCPPRMESTYSCVAKLAGEKCELPKCTSKEKYFEMITNLVNDGVATTQSPTKAPQKSTKTTTKTPKKPKN